MTHRTVLLLVHLLLGQIREPTRVLDVCRNLSRKMLLFLLAPCPPLHLLGRVFRQCIVITAEEIFVPELLNT